MNACDQPAALKALPTFLLVPPLACSLCSDFKTHTAEKRGRSAQLNLGRVARAERDDLDSL